MMRLALVLCLVAAVARGATAQVCSASPVLRAGLFNTTGTIDAPNVAARAAAMATALPQTAQEQNLDVLCLNELRDAELRNTALQGFVGDPGWNIYQPEAIRAASPVVPGPVHGMPKCRNACTNNLFNAFGMTLPLNKWVEFCTLNPIPGFDGYRCVDAATELEFHECINQFCPFLVPQLLSNNNARCMYCMQERFPTETLTSRTLRCAAQFVAADADKCPFGYAGEAGATLLSRYPFVATEYREFTRPASNLQPGLANWGITYGKIQTDAGPVHLFCASHATAESGMNSGAAEPLNAAQSQEALDYIESKANGEMAVYLASTGSGPALISSSTGPASAQWPDNFTLLQSGLTDSLLSNLDDSSNPLSAAACTYGCSEASASYVDHIMTSGEDTTANGYGLCARNGGTLFTSPTLSSHYGVRADLALAGLCKREPETGCRAAGRSRLVVANDPERPERKNLTWVWARGAETLLAALGDPTTDNAYSLCVYDGRAGVPSLTFHLDVAASADRWRKKHPKVWTYKDKTGVSTGFTRIQLSSRADGRARASIMAKGPNLPLSTAFSASQLFESNPGVLVQLVNRDGQCWESSFAPGDAIENDGVIYKARNEAP